MRKRLKETKKGRDWPILKKIETDHQYPISVFHFEKGQSQKLNHIIMKKAILKNFSNVFEGHRVPPSETRLGDLY